MYRDKYGSNAVWLFRSNDLPLVKNKHIKIPTIACMAAVTVLQTAARRRPVDNNHAGYMFKLYDTELYDTEYYSIPYHILHIT